MVVGTAAAATGPGCTIAAAGATAGADAAGAALAAAATATEAVAAAGAAGGAATAAGADWTGATTAAALLARELLLTRDGLMLAAACGADDAPWRPDPLDEDADESLPPAGDALRVWARAPEEDESAEPLVSANATGMSATP
jgi:hypothetical protein